MNAAEFNALYEVGVPVFAYPGARPENDRSARRLVTRTRSEATVLGGHTDVVWVDGHSACIALTHVDVVSEDEYLAAVVAEQGALPVPAGDAPKRDAEDELTGARLSLWEEEQTTARLRLAWRSARRRARAYGEGILRHVADRDYWKDQCRQAQARVAELEALTPATIQTCRKCGAGYTYGEPCSTCEFRARMAAEGEHYAAVHHTYLVGRDLPETGGV